MYLFQHREVLREFVCSGPLWMASEVLRNLYVVVPLFKILYDDRTFLRGGGEVQMIPAACPVTALW
jgi:hypothetical protein